MEQYFTEDTTMLNDGFCEAALKSLMVNTKKCLENPEDYTARAEMMLACISKQGIEATYKFFESINIPMLLREVGIDEKRLGEMAHHVAENEGLDKAWAPLSEQDIKEIFEASL